MKITDLNYKGRIDWGIDTKDMDFKKCEEMPQETPLNVHGFFKTPDNGYGHGAVAILDDVLLNLPQRYVEMVNTILSDDVLLNLPQRYVEMVDTILSDGEMIEEIKRSIL